MSRAGYAGRVRCGLFVVALAFVMFTGTGTSWASPDVYEPDDLPGSASSITVGESQLRTIDPVSDVDIVGFDAVAGGTYRVRIAALPNLWTAAAIHDSSDNLIVDIPFLGFSNATFTAPSAQRYHVHVSGVTAGTYELRVTDESPYLYGFVTGDEGARLEGIEVRSFNYTWGTWSTSVLTAADGSYRIGPLPSGQAGIVFTDPADIYVAEWHEDVPGNPGDPFSGGTTLFTNGGEVRVDASLSRRTTIAGSVTDTDGAVSGAQVVLQRKRVGGWYQWVGTVVTDATGGYSFTGLVAGEYQAYAAADGHRTMYYNGVYATPDSFAIESGTTADVDFAFPAYGGLQGVVTQEATMGAASLAAYRDEPGNAFGMWIADCDPVTGAYTLPNLPVGEYRVLAWSGQHVVSGHAGAIGVWDAASPLLTPITISADSTGTISIDLHLMSGVNGTVRDEAGNPLGGIRVWLWQQLPNGIWSDYNDVLTDASGQFTMWAPPGEYVVQYEDPGAAYVSSVYGSPLVQSPSDPAAARITLGTGAQLSSIDATLSTGSTVGGTVVDPLGQGVEGAWAELYVRRQDGMNWDWAGVTSTAPDGSYSIAALRPGAYRVRFASPAGEYVPQVWPAAHGDSLNALDAADIVLDGYADRMDIDAQFDEGATISGRVLDADGSPVVGIGVGAGAYDAGGQWLGGSWVNTDDQGYYTMSGLVEGSHRVYCQAGERLDLLPQVYDGVLNENPSEYRATLVNALPGVETTGIDFVLPYAGSIEGRVTSAATGDPVPNVWATAYWFDESQGQWVPAGNSGYTDENGYYVIPRLFGNTYRVVVANSAAYPDKLVVDPGQAGLGEVPVTVGTTVVGVDIQIPVGGTLTGVITDEEGGAPLEGAGVWAVRVDPTTRRAATGLLGIAYTTTGPDGSYSFSTLPDGEYVVCASRGDRGATYSGGDGSPENATLRSVRNGTTVSADVALPLLGIVEGTARVAPGMAGLESVNIISEYRDQYLGPMEYATVATDANGHYEIFAPVRCGTLKLMGPGWTTRYYYGGSSIPETARTLGFGPSRALSGIDFTVESAEMTSNNDTCRSCHGQEFDDIHLTPTYRTIRHIYAPGDTRFGRQTVGWFCNECHSGVQYWGQTGSEAGRCNRCHIETPSHRPDNTLCIDCHQREYASGPHDLRGEHLTDVPSMCLECHSGTLTAEHVLPNRYTSAGRPITCASCHESTDPDIRDVARTGDWADDAKVWSVTMRGQGLVLPASPDHVEETSVTPQWSMPGAAPIERIKVGHNGTGTARLFALYGGSWHEVYAHTEISYDIESTTIEVPGATALRWSITNEKWVMGSSTAWSEQSVWVDVLEPGPAAVTCLSCHTGGSHAHRTALLPSTTVDGQACSECHSADLLAEHSKASANGSGNPCVTCHADGGAFESVVGQWSRRCDSESCHGAASPQPMHAVDMVQPVDAVDRDTVCNACHISGLVGTHPYHQSGSNCGAACHPGWGNTRASAMPAYTDPTSGASFASAASKSTSPARLHQIHTEARWPGALNTPSSACASCHAVAACETCHAGAIPESHAVHSSLDQTSNPAWVGRVGYGIVGTDQTQRTSFTESVQCGSAGCHDIAGMAANTYRSIEDYNYAVGGNPDDLTGTNAAITTIGTWRYRANMRYAGGRMSYANIAGAGLRASFVGQRLEIVSDKDPYRGRAEVWVDGALAGFFDSYSATTQFQATVFTLDLAAGAHVVEVRPTGTKQASSRGTYVVVDCFKVFSDAPSTKIPACTDCH